MNHCADCGAEIADDTWRCPECKAKIPGIFNTDDKIKAFQEKLKRWAVEARDKDEVYLAEVKDCLL